MQIKFTKVQFISFRVFEIVVRYMCELLSLRVGESEVWKFAV